MLTGIYHRVPKAPEYSSSALILIDREKQAADSQTGSTQSSGPAAEPDGTGEGPEHPKDATCDQN